MTSLSGDSLTIIAALLSIIILGCYASGSSLMYSILHKRWEKIGRKIQSKLEQSTKILECTPENIKKVKSFNDFIQGINVQEHIDKLRGGKKTLKELMGLSFRVNNLRTTYSIEASEKIRYKHRILKDSDLKYRRHKDSNPYTLGPVFCILLGIIALLFNVIGKNIKLTEPFLYVLLWAIVILGSVFWTVLYGLLHVTERTDGTQIYRKINMICQRLIKEDDLFYLCITVILSVLFIVFSCLTFVWYYRLLLIICAIVIVQILLGFFFMNKKGSPQWKEFDHTFIFRHFGIIFCCAVVICAFIWIGGCFNYDLKYSFEGLETRLPGLDLGIVLFLILFGLVVPMYVSMKRINIDDVELDTIIEDLDNELKDADTDEDISVRINSAIPIIEEWQLAINTDDTQNGDHVRGKFVKVGRRLKKIRKYFQ